MATLGKLREIITRYTPSSGGALRESGPLPIIKECLLFFLLIVLVFHIYAHSKDGPFVFDDLNNIADNSHIHISRLD